MTCKDCIHYDQCSDVWGEYTKNAEENCRNFKDACKFIELRGEEILAIKAVYYLAARNNRLRHGGIYVEDIKNYESCGKIPFVQAVNVVDDMLNRIDEAINRGKECCK